MKQIALKVRYNKFIAVPKSVGVSGYAPKVDSYITYIKDNGEKIFVLDNTLATKETGNAYYKKVKEQCSKVPMSNYSEDAVVVTEMTDDEFVAQWDYLIDKYPEYIDDYKQQQDTINRNAKIQAIIDAVKR